MTTTISRLQALRGFAVVFLFSFPTLYFAQTPAAFGAQCAEVFIGQSEALAKMTARRLTGPLAGEAVGENLIAVDLPATDAVLDLFTTADGTLRPLFPALVSSVIPRELRMRLLEQAPQKDPLDTPWNSLSKEDQRKLIAVAAGFRPFVYSPQPVPGLIYREVIRLRLRQEIRLGNQFFGPGEVDIPSSLLFSGKAIIYNKSKRGEMPLPFSLSIPAGVNAAASTADSLSVARELARLDSKTSGQLRLRMEGPYPFLAEGRMSANNTDLFRMAYFAMLVRMKLDFTMINDRVTLVPSSEMQPARSDLYSIDPVETGRFLRLGMISMGLDTKTPFSVYSGTVGIESHHELTRSDTWAIELRYLSKTASNRDLQQTVAAIEMLMRSGELLLSQAEAETFLKTHPYTPALFTFPELPEPSVVQALPFRAHSRFLILLSKNDHLRYLLADWSKIALTKNWAPDSTPMRRLRRAQLRTLEMVLEMLSISIDKAEQELPVLLQTFIHESGLAAEVDRQFQL